MVVVGATMARARELAAVGMASSGLLDAEMMMRHQATVDGTMMTSVHRTVEEAAMTMIDHPMAEDTVAKMMKNYHTDDVKMTMMMNDEVVAMADKSKRLPATARAADTVASKKKATVVDMADSRSLTTARADTVNSKNQTIVDKVAMNPAQEALVEAVAVAVVKRCLVASKRMTVRDEAEDMDEEAMRMRADMVEAGSTVEGTRYGCWHAKALTAMR